MCAYRVHTGHCSCSQLGYRAIRRFGVGKGWLVLCQRTALCGVAHRRHAPAPPRPLARERGDCAFDLPYDLDFTPSAGKLDVWDACNCCDAGSCDWPSRKNKRQAERDPCTYCPTPTEKTARVEAPLLRFALPPSGQRPGEIAAVGDAGHGEKLGLAHAIDQVAQAAHHETV